MPETEEWTPGFGKPYFKEPKFYVSPTLKEANIPDDQINVANASHVHYDRYYTNEEIMQIWAKPLENYEVTEEERTILKENPYAIGGLLLLSSESPCSCHVKNMYLDRCDDPEVGTSNSTMLQDTACHFHYYSLMKCMAKHWTWYDLRREALRQALPEEVKKYTTHAKNLTRYDADPSEYYQKN